MQRFLRVPDRGYSSGTVVIAAETVIRAGQRCDVLLTVSQQFPPGIEFLFLPRHQFRPLQLTDLKSEGVHPPRFFRFIHLKRTDLLPQSCHGGIFLSVSGKGRVHPAEAIQISAVLLLVQKLLPVMLTVDIQKLSADLPQLRDSQRPPVDPAGVFAVRRHLALQEEISVFIRGDAVFRQPRKLLRNVGKHSADKRLGRPGTDQLP